MAFAVTKFDTLAQNHINKGIASNLYAKSAMLAVLGALSLGNNSNTDALAIGRPGSGEVLSGGVVSPMQKKMLSSINAYEPRVQLFATNNTAARTGDGRVALPDVANKTTESHAQAIQAAAKFHWCHIDTPILIWHEDKIRAGREGTKEGQAIAIGQVIEEATEIAKQDIIEWLANKVWTGNPGSQSANLWSEPLGVVQAVSATNTYAQVDRSVETKWASQVDSVFTAADVEKLVDDANLTKEIRVKGQGVNLLITTTTLYQKFKAQIKAKGGVTVLNDQVIKMGKLGLKNEVLQVDNVFVTYDAFCPANTVVLFDTSVWKFIVHPDFNFKVTKFVDNTTTGLNKDAYDYAYIQLRFMLTCDNPFRNVRYSAIGT